MYVRSMATRVLDALGDTPVVLLNGARQTGKTTLVRHIAAASHPARYFTLDDAGVLAAARTDPVGFVAGLGGPAVIDEAQRAPELFPAIKAAVDRDRSPGRFLLTGSANVLSLPRLADSLVGRMEILTLWPLAQREIVGASGSVCDALFEPDTGFVGLAPVDRADLLERVVRGGYPEPLARHTAVRRRAWYRSYVTTILQRDVRDLSSVEGLTAMPRLLTLLATRSSALLNVSDLSRSVGIPYTTLNRYLALLEATYLLHPVPAWSGNLGLRLVKSPKAMLDDTGLAADLLGADSARIAADGALTGALLESFVALELLKDAGWSSTQPRLYHFRSHAGQEVDVVLEDRAGRIVGIEVKAGATIGASDLRGLRALADALGDRFVRGVVLYPGRQVIPFGERVHAVPLSLLWSAL